MSEMEGGQWGEGGTEGRRFAKYNKFFNKNYNKYDLLNKTHQMKQLFNNTHIIQGFFFTKTMIFN